MSECCVRMCRVLSPILENPLEVHPLKSQVNFFGGFRMPCGDSVDFGRYSSEGEEGIR